MWQTEVARVNLSPPNKSERLSEHLRRLKFVVVRLVILCILVIVVYQRPLETNIINFFSLAVGSTFAEYFYLFLLVPLGVLIAYYAYKIYMDLSSFIIDSALSRLKMRTATPTILILNRILGLILLITIAIWLLSNKLTFLSGYAESVLASFSGLFSLLITLIVAMQMKELGGNFIAGLLLRSSEVVSEGDYIRVDREYVRVEKIDSTYTRVMNILNEQIFIPNLKFLTDNFRRPYSKQNREFIDLQFSMSYTYSPAQVEQDISELVNRYNQTSDRSVKIDEFLVVTVDLAPYSAVYELRVKPSAPIFPEAIRSDFRRLLHEKYGEDLASPMLLNIKK